MRTFCMMRLVDTFYTHWIALAIICCTLIYETRSATEDDGGVDGLESGYTRFGGELFGDEIIPSTDAVSDVLDPNSGISITECRSNLAEVMWRAAGVQGGRSRHVLQVSSAHEPERWNNATELVATGNQVHSSRISLAPWGTYTFRVFSVDDNSSMAPSSAKCATPPEQPWTNPTNVRTLTSEKRKLVVTWDTVPRQQHNGPGFGYLVKYRKEGDTAWQTAVINDPATNVFKTDVDGDYVTYEIVVMSRNSLGEATMTALIHRGYTGEADPLQPWKVVAYATSPTEIAIEWGPPVGIDGLGSYTLEYSRTNRTFQTRFRKHFQPSVTAYQLNDVIPNTTYVIRLFGISKEGGTLSAAHAVVKTKELVAIQTAEVIVLGGGPTMIFIQWHQPRNLSHPTDIEGYKIVCVKVDHEGEPMPQSDRIVALADASRDTAIIDGLEPGTRYAVKMAAYTRSGEGRYSEEIYATTVSATEAPSSSTDTPSNGELEPGSRFPVSAFNVSGEEHHKEELNATTEAAAGYVCSNIGVAGHSCGDLVTFFGNKKRMCKRLSHECCKTCSHKKVCRRERPVVAGGNRVKHNCADLVSQFGRQAACTIFTRECCKTCGA